MQASARDTAMGSLPLRTPRVAGPLTRANPFEVMTVNKYWDEHRNAVQDGGKLRSDQACALFDYIADLEREVRGAMNENNILRWTDVVKLMDRGPEVCD
jgi:hypothetical protein